MIFNYVSLWLLFLLVILIASLLFLFIAAPKSKGGTLRTNDSIIGSFGIVKTPVDKNGLTKIEIHGTIWNAISYETLSEGERVFVVARDNLTLTVSKTETF
jgi:membrane protein implicated in regulation of membrane protease activity